MDFVDVRQHVEPKDQLAVKVGALRSSFSAKILNQRSCWVEFFNVLFPTNINYQA